MAIVSSTIIEDAPQRDGRRHVCERHVDHAGLIHFIRYLAEQAADVSATMAARVAAIEAELKERELRRAVRAALEDGPAVQPTLHWSTNTEFGLALREFYKTATQRDACRIGWFVTQFNLTDNQLRTFFGLTAGQVAAARTKLSALATQYESLLTAAGE
jgi:hypothetical protein